MFHAHLFHNFWRTPFLSMRFQCHIISLYINDIIYTWFFVWKHVLNIAWQVVEKEFSLYTLWRIFWDKYLSFTSNPWDCFCVYRIVYVVHLLHLSEDGGSLITLGSILVVSFIIRYFVKLVLHLRLVVSVILDHRLFVKSISAKSIRKTYIYIPIG